ncbi:hypothetical protein D3C76_758240 [compost metagenome]
MLSIESVEQLFLITRANQAVVKLVPQCTDSLDLEPKRFLQGLSTIQGQVFTTLSSDKGVQRTHARPKAQPAANQRDD